MTAYCKMLADNSKYFMATDFGIAHFFKLVTTDADISNWIMGNKELWDWMLKWSEQNKTPPSIHSNSKIKMYKRASNWQSGQSSMKVNTERALRVKKLLKGEVFRMNEYDSDEDVSELEFSPGDQIWTLD